MDICPYNSKTDTCPHNNYKAEVISVTRKDARQNRQIIMEAFHKATRVDQAHLPTMSDIVKISGLGRGTVYRHFPDPGALAFSFISTGYEVLFARTRDNLKAANTRQQTREALEDHLYRYRAFNVDNLTLLTIPDVVTSEGCDLALTSQRQSVRRAIRDMAGIGKTSPSLLETAVDLISRTGDPLHLKYVGLKQQSPDPLAKPAVEFALSLADQIADQLTLEKEASNA
ncbi:TetR/AcrR family transcriptional regulator [Sneathiella limimaris]|uniref:TetR/AcrR family transcriptional regulator n=1 Tax=Sneathiella limimaris TaxID=1964213 RepID=UPI0019D0A2FF|nr:TetR/AcrR family transcriptional regulator [Sneathiella limimaris]